MPSGRWPQGKTNGGIKQALFLSESTVEKHVDAIFTKPGLIGCAGPSPGRRPTRVPGKAPPSDRLDSARMLSYFDLKKSRRVER
jgi:hypothetical protein